MPVGGACANCVEPCAGDTNDDCVVDLDDLLAVIAQWGTECDTDGDGMPDWWENGYGMFGIDLFLDDADMDADMDGLSNIEEYNLGINPVKRDTDDDGMDDGVEVNLDSDPDNPASIAQPNLDTHRHISYLVIADSVYGSTAPIAVRIGSAIYYDDGTDGYGDDHSFALYDEDTGIWVPRDRPTPIEILWIGNDNTCQDVSNQYFQHVDFRYQASICVEWNDPGEVLRSRCHSELGDSRFLFDPDGIFDDHSDDPEPNCGSLSDADAPTEFYAYGRQAWFLPDIDLDVDSDNNDGLSMPTGDLAEESMEGAYLTPGKVLLTNTNDADFDGIPGYADGMGIYPDIDYAESADRFVPMVLRLNALGDLPTDLRSQLDLVFSYEGASPAILPLVPPADWTTFQRDPLAGHIRVWTHDGDDPQRDWRNVSEGGSFVATGGPSWDPLTQPVRHPLTDFEVGIDGDIVLYVEGFFPLESADLHSSEIRVDLIPSGSVDSIFSIFDTFADKVTVSPIEMGYLAVAEDDSLERIAGPTKSHSSPTIDMSQFQIDLSSPSPEYDHIIATVQVTGAVDDEASDILAGELGEIDHLEVYLNGDPAIDVLGNPITVPIAVTKVTTSTLRKPYDYSGAFSTSLDLPVGPGWNTVRLVATNAHGIGGFYEKAFEVDATAPPDQVVDVELTFTSEPYLADTVQASITRDGSFVGTYTLDRFGDTFCTDIDGEALIIGAPDIITDAIELDSFISDFTHEPWDLTSDPIRFEETGGNTWVFEGQSVLEEYERENWENYELLLLGVEEEFSTGGVFEPFVMDLRAPSFLAQIIDINIAFPALNQTGVTYTPQAVAEYIALFAAHLTAPSPFLLTQSDLRDNELAAGMQQWAERRDGTWSFVQGFGTGLWDTGEGIVDSIAFVADSAWYLIKNYNSVTMVFRFVSTGSATIDSDEAAIRSFAEGAQTIAQIAWQLVQGGAEAYEAALTGDYAQIAELSQQYALAIEYSAEIIEAIDEYLDTVDDYTQGRVVGNIVGEAVLALGTAGGAAALKSVKGAELVATLTAKFSSPMPDLPATASDEIVAKLDDLATYFAELATTAGTPVHTLGGIRSIEDVNEGDLVLSRDPATGEMGYKPVVQTFVTHPDTLYHVSYSAGAGSIDSDTLTGTGEHPFYVVDYDAFVPADELKIGDRLLLSDGITTAFVTDIQVERGPPASGSYTTYNFEVVDWHTYFVGEADRGIWVHNTGDKACERAFALITRYKNRLGLDDYDAFKRLAGERVGQQIVNSSWPSASSRTLGDVVDTIVKERVPDLDANAPFWTSGQPGNPGANLYEHWQKRVRFDQLSHLDNAVAYAEEAITLSRTTTAEVSTLVKVGWRKKGQVWEKVVLDMRGGKNGVVVKVVEGVDANQVKTYMEVTPQFTPLSPLDYFNNETTVYVKPVSAVD